MSFNGSGVFVVNTTGQPVVTNTTITSTAFNALTADLAVGLTTCLTKDGQSTPTANLPMGGYKITGAAVGTTSTDYITVGQIQAQSAPAKRLFYAQNSVAQTVTSGVLTTVTLAAVLDPNSNFAADAYTAPTTGFYEFTGSVSCVGTTITVVQLDLYKNGAFDQRFCFSSLPAAIASITIGGTVFTQATAADVFLLKAIVTGTGTVQIVGNTTTQFGGRLISS